MESILKINAKVRIVIEIELPNGPTPVEPKKPLLHPNDGPTNFELMRWDDDGGQHPS